MRSYIPYRCKKFSRGITKGKYKFRPEIFSTITSQILDCFPDKNFPSNALLIPIPLHFFRKQRRGFNQSQIIAQTLHTAFEEYEVCDLLIRVKNTAQQARCTEKKRQQNIKDAFSINKKIILPNKTTPLVLIDDVVTSGATLIEAKKILQACGYKNISALTLGYKQQ